MMISRTVPNPMYMTPPLRTAVSPTSAPGRQRAIGTSSHRLRDRPVRALTFSQDQRSPSALQYSVRDTETREHYRGVHEAGPLRLAVGVQPPLGGGVGDQVLRGLRRQRPVQHKGSDSHREDQVVPVHLPARLPVEVPGRERGEHRQESGRPCGEAHTRGEHPADDREREHDRHGELAPRRRAQHGELELQHRPVEDHVPPGPEGEEQTDQAADRDQEHEGCGGCEPADPVEALPARFG